MAELSITLDTAGFDPAAVARQLPFAAAKALNALAGKVKAAEVQDMKAVFDRPTPWTLNALTVAPPATKSRLSVTVKTKDSIGKRHYLAVEVAGGARPQTGFERFTAPKLPVPGHVQAILPADNARLDQYGNWSRGQRNQVLSGLKAWLDPLNNATPRSQKRGRKRGRATYFVPQHGLPPGIYSRSATGQLGIVAAFSDKPPVYRPRFDFYGVAHRTVAAWAGPLFAIAWDEAWSTRRR